MRFADGHEQVAQALAEREAGEPFKRAPKPGAVGGAYPTVEFMLPDLLMHHESMHIGQMSIWRRAAGVPGVTFPDRSPRPGLLEHRTCG